MTKSDAQKWDERRVTRFGLSTALALTLFQGFVFPAYYFNTTIVPWPIGTIIYFVFAIGIIDEILSKPDEHFEEPFAMRKLNTKIVLGQVCIAHIFAGIHFLAITCPK